MVRTLEGLGVFFLLKVPRHRCGGAAGQEDARRELMNLDDDVWTKVNIEFHRDAEDGVFKVSE